MRNSAESKGGGQKVSSWTSLGVDPNYRGKTRVTVLRNSHTRGEQNRTWGAHLESEKKILTLEKRPIKKTNIAITSKGKRDNKSHRSKKTGTCLKGVLLQTTRPHGGEKKAAANMGRKTSGESTIGLKKAFDAAGLRWWVARAGLQS